MKIKYIFLILCLLFTHTIEAQVIKKLSLDEALTIGIENNKILRSSYYQSVAGQSKYDETKTLGLPSLKLNASYTRLSEVDPFSITTPFGNFDINPVILNSYSAKLTLQQPIYTGNRISGAIDATKYLSLASTEDFNKQLHDTKYSIKNAYWNLYRAILMNKVLTETYNNISARTTDAKNLFDQGLLTKNDLLKLQVQQADIKFKMLEAANSVTLANKYLNNILSLPLNTIIDPVTEVTMTAEQFGDLSSLVTEAIQNRPEIKGNVLRRSAAESNISVAKAGYYPQLAFRGNFTYAQPNPRIFPAQEKFKDTWDVSLVLSYDLWNWFATSYASQQAEANYESLAEGISALREGVELEVTQSYIMYTQSSEKYDVAKLGLEQAEENMKLTAAKFKEGMALSSDIIDAETALFQAKANYTSALIDHELAKAKLNKSIGR